VIVYRDAPEDHPTHFPSDHIKIPTYYNTQFTQREGRVHAGTGTTHCPARDRL